MVEHSFGGMATSSTSPSHHVPCSEKKHWWLTTKKMVEKQVREARVMMSNGEETRALSQVEAALSLSPRYEAALELKARCLLSLRRYKEVADMLQDYIPSYKMANSDDSSGSSSSSSSSSTSSSSSSSDNSRVKLLRSSSSGALNSHWDSPPTSDYRSFKCFSVSDLKKRVLSGLAKNAHKDTQWRYLVLGQACCHLGLMEDALVLVQHGKRLASAAFRRESICWSDDSFSLSLSSDSETTSLNQQPLSESESISHLVAQIKLLLRRRAAALAALDAGLYSESIRHFSKILDGRRPAPQAFLTECYLHRSAAFKSAGRIAESIADLNRTLSLDPNSTAALQARAALYELIGCITDSVHDLEHVKLIYNSILRDRKPPGPAWKPRSVPYREIPGRLCALGSKIQQLKQRIAMGETGTVDYYALMGLRRGCSRSELDRAHLLLVLKHKPEKSISFIERCEFAEGRDYDSAKDRARMSSVLLYRLIQKGYSSLSATIAAEEVADKERKKAQMALQQAHKIEIEQQKQRMQQQQVQHEVEIEPIMKKGELDQVVDRPDERATNGVGSSSFPYQGVFCRDLAVVGTLLSQVRFNRPLAVKYEALTC